MLGALKISRRHFYLIGGFSNPDLFRTADRQGRWSYWERFF